MRGKEGFRPENPRAAFVARVAELAKKFAESERIALPGKPVNLKKSDKNK